MDVSFSSESIKPAIEQLLLDNIGSILHFVETLKSKGSVRTYNNLVSYATPKTQDFWTPESLFPRQRAKITLQGGSIIPKVISAMEDSRTAIERNPWTLNLVNVHQLINDGRLQLTALEDRATQPLSTNEPLLAIGLLELALVFMDVVDAPGYDAARLRIRRLVFHALFDIGNYQEAVEHAMYGGKIVHYKTNPVVQIQQLLDRVACDVKMYYWCLVSRKLTSIHVALRSSDPSSGVLQRGSDVYTTFRTICQGRNKSLSPIVKAHKDGANHEIEKLNKARRWASNLPQPAQTEAYTRIEEAEKKQKAAQNAQWNAGVLRMGMK